MLARHGNARRMNDVCLNIVRPKPAGQPEAITAGLECDGNAFDFAAKSDCLISPALQEAQQRAFVSRQLLQRLAVEPRLDPGYQPTRLTQSR
jgi:hypothetical protein